MLNLSKLARESSNYSLMTKIKLHRNQDVYLAENLRDYKKNAPTFEVPWYKTFPILDGSVDRAGIILQNVGLRKSSHENWFLLHDDSGSDLVYWNADNPYFRAAISFEEAQEQQALKEDDWVYDVFLNYLIPDDLPNIVEVTKYKFSNKKPEKNSLAETIKNFSPEIGLDW